MSGSFLFSRRALLGGIAGIIGMRALPGRATDEKPPSDRGIGGTGISGLPDPAAPIGFIGSIQRFGSIYVNGDRITYPEDVAVMIDGRARSTAELTIGQVVKTVATPRDGKLVTDRIDVTSEVVGAIERLEGDTIVILGQRVGLGTTGSAHFSLGERVAVSGFRRADGMIVGRLVEPAGDRSDQVVGTVEFRGWTLWLGELQLFGPDARYDGYRVVVRGRRTARGLMVTSIGPDQLPDGRNVRTLSIEAYVSHHGAGLQLGSGIVISGASTSIAPGARNQPSIVSIRLANGGGRPAAGSVGSLVHGGGGFTPPGTPPTARRKSYAPDPSSAPAMSPSAPQDSGPAGYRNISSGMTYRSTPGAGWVASRGRGL